ncbi:UNVERIFIED_CONTAM: hypothetical protein HDU68_002590 [Siphonaria sp. JEL0065]|nr:hypothetical protein HDU68_002590 [Siphonaria sp. JEL0065]
MTYYDDLDVPPSADLDTIKRHYVKEAYANAFNKQAFENLAVAFLVVTSDQKKYDEFLAHKSSSYTIPSAILKRDAQLVFENAFNEVADIVEVPVNKDGTPKSNLYTVLGTVSGLTLGFIVGGPLGAAAGAVIGGGSGHVRDVHGMSTYEAFMKMEESKRQEIMNRVVFAGTVAAKVIL